MKHATKTYITPKIFQIDRCERDTGLVPFAVAASGLAAYAAARAVVNAIKIDSLKSIQNLRKINRESEAVNMGCI